MWRKRSTKTRNLCPMCDVTAMCLSICLSLLVVTLLFHAQLPNPWLYIENEDSRTTAAAAPYKHDRFGYDDGIYDETYEILADSAIPAQPLVNPQPSNQSPQSNIYAYVFYVTSRHYICYALINIDRMINQLNVSNDIDFVLLVMKGAKIDEFCTTCLRRSIKIKMVDRIRTDLAMNTDYEQSYLRFEAFRLIEYKRIVILDADGLVLRNIDHLLLDMDMEGYQLAGSMAHYLTDWLSSVILVVQPSLTLYSKVTRFLDLELLDKVISRFAGGSRYDMDILNFVFERGARVKKLSKYYAILETYLQEWWHYDELNQTFYVHFSGRKPLNDPDTRTLGNAKSETDHPINWIYRTFWRLFDRRCSHLVRKSGPPPLGAGDNGLYYPDPGAVLEELKNKTDVFNKLQIFNNDEYYVQWN